MRVAATTNTHAAERIAHPRRLFLHSRTARRPKTAAVAVTWPLGKLKPRATTSGGNKAGRGRFRRTFISSPSAAAPLRLTRIEIALGHLCSQHSQAATRAA